MPTAMPEAPFISTFGSLDGKNLGSINVPSKLGIQSTVPWDISVKRFCEYDESRHSVYLYRGKTFWDRQEIQSYLDLLSKGIE